MRAEQKPRPVLWDLECPVVGSGHAVWVVSDDEGRDLRDGATECEGAVAAAHVLRPVAGFGVCRGGRGRQARVVPIVVRGQVERAQLPYASLLLEVARSAPAAVFLEFFSPDREASWAACG